MSILIDSVTPHTPAAKAGIRAGDHLVAVNGNLIHDVLDYRFYMIDTALTVEVERDSKPLTFHIKRGVRRAGAGIYRLPHGSPAPLRQ